MDTAHRAMCVYTTTFLRSDLSLPPPLFELPPNDADIHTVSTVFYISGQWTMSKILSKLNWEVSVFYVPCNVHCGREFEVTVDKVGIYI